MEGAQSLHLSVFPSKEFLVFDCNGVLGRCLCMIKISFNCYAWCCGHCDCSDKRVLPQINPGLANTPGI